MSSLQRRIATVSDTTANLIVQLRELDRLRDQVREALLSVGNRSNRNGGMDTGQNRPTVNLPLAAADLLNRLRQPIDRPRQGKTCNRGLTRNAWA